MNDISRSLVSTSASEAYAELHRAVVDAARFVAHRHNESFPGVAESLDDLVITVGRTARSGMYGSFTPGCWRHAGRSIPEIFINPAGFDGEVGRTLAIQTFDTIAHELAHFINFLDGTKGTSRGGRWHNRRWAEVAFELGLIVAKDGYRGHRSAGIRPSYLGIYADVLRDLEDALALTWLPRTSSGRGVLGVSALPLTTPTDATVQPPSSKYVSAVCRCRDGRGNRRAIRVAAGWWGLGPIQCGVCGADFATSAGVSDADVSTRK